jgi:hypothetical protein
MINKMIGYEKAIDQEIGSHAIANTASHNAGTAETLRRKNGRISDASSK